MANHRGAGIKKQQTHTVDYHKERRRDQNLFDFIKRTLADIQMTTGFSPSYDGAMAWLRRHKDILNTAFRLVHMYPTILSEDCAEDIWLFLHPFLLRRPHIEITSTDNKSYLNCIDNQHVDNLTTPSLKNSLSVQGLDTLWREENGQHNPRISSASSSGTTKPSKLSQINIREKDKRVSDKTRQTRHPTSFVRLSKRDNHIHTKTSSKNRTRSLNRTDSTGYLDVSKLTCTAITNELIPDKESLRENVLPPISSDLRSKSTKKVANGSRKVLGKQVYVDMGISSENPSHCLAGNTDEKADNNHGSHMTGDRQYSTETDPLTDNTDGGTVADGNNRPPSTSSSSTHSDSSSISALETSYLVFRKSRRGSVKPPELVHWPLESMPRRESWVALWENESESEESAAFMFDPNFPLDIDLRSESVTPDLEIM